MQTRCIWANQIWLFSKGNIFNKRLEKNDQKEGLFKRLENIKDKNEKLLNAFSAAIKVIKSAKNQSEYNCENTFAFYSFYRGFKKFERMSLGSKYGEINDFYMLLNAFINRHEAITKLIFFYKKALY